MAQNSASELFIVDNSDSDWKVRSYLSDWCDLSGAIDIATGCFEIGSLPCLKEQWQKVDRIRLLIGDEVSLKTRRACRVSAVERTREILTAPQTLLYLAALSSAYTTDESAGYLTAFVLPG